MKASHFLLLTFGFVICCSFVSNNRSPSVREKSFALKLTPENKSVKYTSDIYHYDNGDVWFETTLHYTYDPSTESFGEFYFEDSKGFTQSNTQSSPETHLANVEVTGDSRGVTGVNLVATDSELVSNMFKNSGNSIVDDLNGLIR